MSLYIAEKNRIQSINPDWSLSVFYQGLKNVSAIDADAGFVFWSQSFLNGQTGTAIYSCRANNRDFKEVFASDSNSEIRDIALDKANQRIYFIINQISKGEIVGYSVMSISYYGENMKLVLDSKNRYSPYSIAVGGDYVFWCDGQNITDGYVMRSNLDGSNVIELLLTSGHIRSICVNGTDLYLGGAGLLARTDFAGENVIYMPTGGLSIIDDIAIFEGSIYICDIGIRAVIQTDLAGNNPKRISNDSITPIGICVVN